MQKLIILISNITVYSQKSESDRVLEKGSWISTDLFLAEYLNLISIQIKK